MLSSAAWWRTRTWIVEYDGRIPCSGRMDVTTGETVNTTASTPVNWVEQFDVGGVVDAANDRLGPVRRAGKYSLIAYHTAATDLTSTDYLQLTMRLDPGGTPSNLVVSRFTAHYGSANARATAPVTLIRDCAAGDVFDFTLKVDGTVSSYTTETAVSVRPHFSIAEIL